MQIDELTGKLIPGTSGTDTSAREPYVGPRPFKEDETYLFFGRKKETEELISLITAHQVVLIYAPSGGGKTSLVNAGLIPKLKGIQEPNPEDPDAVEDLEVFDVLKPMRVQGQVQSGFKIGKEVNIYMFNALSSGEEGLDRSILSDMSFADFLKARPKRINEFGEPARRVVIFDQFEELFTAYPERWEDRKKFFEQVGDALVGNPRKEIEGDPLLRVVFSIREDYIAELDPYASLLPECLRTRFRLEQMKENSALEAVEDPLKKRNISFAPKVAKRLVKSLLEIPDKGNKDGPKFGQYIEPVQLQIVCQSLWEALGPGETVITQKHLDTYGDLSQVLSQFYEKGVKRVAEKTGELEAKLRTWFENTLIVDGNRAPVTQGRDMTGGMPTTVVELLEQKSLLKKEYRGSDTFWYELAHDSFIEPIRKSNEEWRAGQGIEVQTHQHLEAKALRWQQGSGGLLEGEELLAAQHLVQGHVKTSKQLEDFVKASRAVAQQRRYRLYKRGVAALVFLLIFMSGLAVFAFHQRGEAKRAWQVADEARKGALAQADIAMRNEQEAKKQGEFARDNLKKEQNVKKELEKKKADADHQRQVAVQEKHKAETALIGERAARKEAVRLKEYAELDKRMLVGYAAQLKKSSREVQLNADKANSSLLAITALRYFDDDPELGVLLAQKASDEFGRTPAGDEVIRAGLASLSNKNHVLREHKRRINFVELSPDGTRVVTASDDKGARLWKWEEASKSVELSGHTKAVLRASFSPDGKRILTAGLDGTAIVWDGFTGALIKRLEGHMGGITRAVWSPDNQYIATASEDATVKIWNSITGEDIETLRGHQNGVHDLAWSPDGTHIATEGFDGTGRIWKLMSDKPVLSGEPILLPGLTGSVSAIAFSPDSKMLITESGPGRATVWNVDTGKIVSVFGANQSDNPNRATVTSVDFSPDSKLAVVADSDGTARVWGIEPSRLISELRGHTRSIYVAEFSLDGKSVVTGSADNTARVWNAATGQSLLLLVGHSGGVKSADFSPRSSHIIVTGSDDGTARVWDTTGGQQLLSELPRQSAAVSSAAFSPEFDPTVSPNGEGNTYIATTSYDGTLRVWDARTGLNRTTPKGFAHYARVSYAAFSRDGKFLVTTSVDETAKVWNVDNNKLTPQSQLEGHTNRVVKAAFSPDSKFVATASLDGTARIWDAKTGKELRKLEDHKDGVALYSVEYSPDGNSIITAGTDKVIRFWDAHTFEFRKELATKHEKDVYGAKYNPTGDLIVTASADGTARVWDAATSTRVAELKGHTDEVNAATFSPDGQFVVTASNDKTARVWDTKTWKVVNVLRGQKGKVFTVAFSPDSKYIVTASDDGTTHIYPPEMFAMPIDDLLKLIPLRIVQRDLAKEWEKFKSETLERRQDKEGG